MRALLSLLVLLAAPAFAREPLACLRGFEAQPLRRAVSVETIHRWPDGSVITIFLPSPAEGNVADLNASRFGFSLPERFTISDGTLQGSFVTVDLTSGSRLDRCVDELARRLTGTAEEKLESLRTLVGAWLAPVPEGFRYPWDGSTPAPLPPAFANAARLAPGHFPLATGLEHPAVPLEAYLAAGHGVCLEKVLLTSMILSRHGLPHRVRAGGTETGGHMWIELPDGRHLDPTWGVLESPAAEARPGWFRVGGTALFRDQFFPFAAESAR